MFQKLGATKLVAKTLPNRNPLSVCLQVRVFFGQLAIGSSMVKLFLRSSKSSSQDQHVFMQGFGLLVSLLSGEAPTNLKNDGYKLKEKYLCEFVRIYPRRVTIFFTHLDTGRFFIPNHMTFLSIQNCIPP